MVIDGYDYQTYYRVSYPENEGPEYTQDREEADRIFRWFIVRGGWGMSVRLHEVVEDPDGCHEEELLDFFEPEDTT